MEIPKQEVIVIPKEKQVSNTVIWMVTAIHAAWGVVLLVVDHKPRTTTLDPILSLVSPHQFVGVLLLGCSFLTAMALVSHGHRILKLAAITPQQILLLLSTTGAIKATLLGEFADGVVRSSAFIFADQIYTIILGLFYMYVLFKKFVITKEPWIT